MTFSEKKKKPGNPARLPGLKDTYLNDVGYKLNMAKRKSQKPDLKKALEREQLKAFRHNISQLKKAGIVSKKIDARAIKPSKHYKGLIRQFADVITGQTKAVKVPKYCPIEGCKTIKKGKTTIALIDVSDKKAPKVKATKQGFQIIDRAFGKSVMDILIKKRASTLLSLGADDLEDLEQSYLIGKLTPEEKKAYKDDPESFLMNRNLSIPSRHSYVFTIEDKKSGKSYMSKISFQSLDQLIMYMGHYNSGGNGSQNFGTATVAIRVMGDADIRNYQDAQMAETAKNKRARQAASRKARRQAKRGGTHNII